MQSETVRVRFALVFERFAEESDAVARLIVADETFRTVCEDYVIARTTLAGFQKTAADERRAEIADYTTLVAELEHELTALLAGG